MMTIEEMIERKKELGYTYAALSEQSGVPLPTVQKVLGGVTRSPRYDTMAALEKVLSPVYDREAPLPYGSEFHRAAFLREPAAEYSAVHPGDTEGDAGVGTPEREFRNLWNCYPLLPYKQQGEYTEEDRERLPDEVRTELIDGFIYDMASPGPVHQILVGEIYGMLRECLQKHGNTCYAFIAPSDVRLDRNKKTMLQPDIYVLCDFSEIGEDGKIDGAPPFVVEVLSPSTRSKDLLLKAYKYCNAGVQEYWIVDPENEKVLVYNYRKDPGGTEYIEYDFNSTVPVSLSDGSCSVDFAKIKALMRRIEGKAGES